MYYLKFGAADGRAGKKEPSAMLTEGSGKGLPATYC